MGQDKALLPGRNGQPLLCQTVQTALQLTSTVMIVTPWPERYRLVLPSERQNVVQFLQEQPSIRAFGSSLGSPSIASVGPLGGFAQGWTQIVSDVCLLLACDLPYLESAVLQRWWDGLQSGAGDMPMASLVPGASNMGKGWEPLCGFYHRRCLLSLYRYLASGGRSFQEWLVGVPVVPYDDVPEKMLFNCNTPEDWATVRL